MLISISISTSCNADRGFARDDDWGYRSLEPTRTVISSIALVLLKTGIHHPPTPSASSSASEKDKKMKTDNDDSDSESETDSIRREKERMGDALEDSRVTIDQQQMGTAQKLLLFWRKPAVSPGISFSSWSLGLTCCDLLFLCWCDDGDHSVNAGGMVYRWMYPFTKGRRRWSA